MTGKEAKEILDQLTKITNNLIDEYDRAAFFEMGALCNKLATIIAVDMSSFNPTLKDNE